MSTARQFVSGVFSLWGQEGKAVKQNNHNKADIKESMYMKLKNKHDEAASQSTLSNPHFLQTVLAGLDH